MLELKVLKPTWLKQSKAQGNTLPDAKRALVAAGAILPVSSFVLDSDHYKISLGLDAQGRQVALKGLNTWYVFLPHVQLLENGSVIASSTEVTKGDRPINAKGLQLLKAFEGCELRAYLCPAGVWTIGYGSTGSHVYPGQSITRNEAEALLKQDLIRFERSVSDAVRVPVNEDQFSALVSFTYNVGEGAFEGSSLLRLLNQRDYQGAAAQFSRWVNGGGGALPGLVRRRNAERALFLGGDYSQYL